jgi:hypothetical protein
VLPAEYGDRIPPVSGALEPHLHAGQANSDAGPSPPIFGAAAVLPSRPDLPPKVVRVRQRIRFSGSPPPQNASHRHTRDQQ